MPVSLWRTLWHRCCGFILKQHILCNHQHQLLQISEIQRGRQENMMNLNVQLVTGTFAYNTGRYVTTMLINMMFYRLYMRT